MKKTCFKSSKIMLAGMCLTGIGLAINGAVFLQGIAVEGQAFYVTLLATVFLLNVLGYVNAKEIDKTAGRTK